MGAPSWAEPYLNRMNSEDNGYGFFWGEFPNPAPFPQGRTGSTGISEYPCSSHTWLKFNLRSQLVTMWEEAYNSGYTQAKMNQYCVYGASTKLTLTITTSERNATGVLDNISMSSVQAYNPDNPSQSWGDAIVFYKDSYGVHVASGNVAYNYSSSYTWTGTTVEEILQQVYKCLRNVYVIVDGDNWTAEITHTWQSVPSISGKNGILQSLSTLVNINDGNPVSGASASAVNIIPASVVSGMIQTGASDVIVSFEIPQLTSGTYDSIKLVGKRGGIPRSKTDGEFIETLSDSDTSKTLTGLTKGYTYWFVIFAEDSKGSSSESDPYPYETGEGESVAFFEIDLGQGGKDIVRYDASKSIGSHKQGELYGNYSIANDELSTNGYIYWDYDATENPKSIPADCCLYFEYDTLFTGNEGYLDWYVLDSNNDQQIYWCYDTKYAFQSDKWYNCLVVAEVKNGYIKRYKYVLDGIEIAHDTANIKMPCTDAEGSIGISEIYFRTTRPTKIKNMSIYYDFSTYTEAGGGGGGGSGASGSNPVS